MTEFSADHHSPALTEPETSETEKPLDVGKAARQGGFWAIVSYSFAKATGFASSIVLARLLLPRDYGLSGMVNTVLGAAAVVGNLGIGAALVHQREDVEEHANTMWWLDMLFGVFLFALANILSPLACIHYHEPKLRWLILAASANFLINPIGGAMGALLRRDLRFRTVQGIAMIQTLTCSLMAIVFAVLGAGVWSFIYPYILGNTLQVVLLWNVCPFRPKLKVRWDLARRLISFGKNLAGASVFLYVNENVAYILLGSLMGGVKLGFYVFAYRLGVWVVDNVWGAISGIVFPTFSAVQKEPDRARAMFLKMLTMVAVIGLPIVCAQWALAPIYIGSIYGSKWLPVVTAFRYIALYGMVKAICSPALSLIAAMGRPDVNFKLNAAASPVIVMAVVLGSKYGINGVAAATAAAHGTFALLWLVIPFRILKWSILDAAVSVLPAAVCSVMAASIAYAIYFAAGDGSSSLLLLIQLVILGALVYIGLGITLFRRTYSAVWSTIKDVLRDVRA